MPQLGLGLRANVSGASIYDADASSYFARASVTDATARRQISDFVAGLKSLGAWNNSIVYLARSSQNKGSGSTVYSLGGLTNNSSTYDATIAGSPTPIWTRSGISTSGGYWSATSPIAGGNTTRSMIAMSQRSASTAGNTDYVVLSTAGIGTKRFAFRQDLIKSTSIDIFDYDAIFGKRFDSLAGFNFQSASYNSSNSSLRYNANAGTDSTATQSLSFSGGTTTTSGGWEPAAPFTGAGTLSMALVSNQFFSKTLCDAIYSLYNSTCGTNLYDVDAEAYFTTAGITDTTAKQQISDFVIGVKGLGLWNNMVCWPLRSTQNSGTGTTAYSLGGLGTFNGTLAGTPNPTWGTDGIVLTNTDSRIDLPDNASIYGARSAMAVFKTSRTGTQAPFEIQANIDQTGYYFVMGYSGNASNGYTGPRFLITRNSTFGFNQSSSRTISSGTFQSVQITSDNTTDNVFQNGSIAASGAQTGLSSINPTGARNIRAMFYRSDDTVGAFSALSTSKWTNQQVSDLNALYKTTLGSGLGLP